MEWRKKLRRIIPILPVILVLFFPSNYHPYDYMAYKDWLAFSVATALLILQLILSVALLFYLEGD